MWRGCLVAGLLFAFLGGIAVVVVMGAAAGCSGGYNCTPNTVAMSISVLFTGLGFLLVLVAFGIRPARFAIPSPVGVSTEPRPSQGSSRLHRTIVVAVVLFVLGLLVSVAGYLEFFSGDWFNAAYATWNYPNAGAGVAILAVGVLMWLSALALVTAAEWRGPRDQTPVAPSTLYSPGAPLSGPLTGETTLPLPPPPPPPVSYPPGAG